jgi:O-antigen ligase
LGNRLRKGETMNTRMFKAGSPLGIAVTLVPAAGISVLILFGSFDVAPRFWAALMLSALSVLAMWRLARTERFSLTALDQLAWAILISHTVIVARVRDVHVLAEEGTISSEIIAEIAIWCVLLVYACGRLLHNLPRLRSLGGTGSKYATLLLVAALGSSLYAANPMITLAWTLKLLTILALGCVLVDSSDPVGSAQRFVSATYFGLLLMLGQYIILTPFSPAGAIETSQVTGIFRLGGELLPATQLAAVAGMVSSLALIDVLNKRRPHFSWPVLVLSVGMMGASLGRGGMLGASVSMLVVLCAFRKARLAVALAGALGLLVVLAPGLMDLSWDILTRRQDQYQLTTITGRVPLWQKAIELIQMKPILGWGYVSGSRVAFLSAFKGWAAIHTHNAILEILVALGVVGLCILLGLLWGIYSSLMGSLRAGWRSINSSQSGLLALKVLSLVILLTIEGMFNAGFAGAPRFEASIMIGAAFAADQLRVHLRSGQTTHSGSMAR